jgi:hypothetical protein
MVGLELFANGFFSSLVLPAAARAALSNGQAQNIGVRVWRSSGIGNIQFYLNGAVIAEYGVASTQASFVDPNNSDGFYIGRDPAFNGSGLNGKFWRASATDFTKGGLQARDWFARDWALNSGRFS